MQTLPLQANLTRVVAFHVCPFHGTIAYRTVLILARGADRLLQSHKNSITFSERVDPPNATILR
jgi:hypothetical protein